MKNTGGDGFIKEVRIEESQEKYICENLSNIGSWKYDFDSQLFILSKFAGNFFSLTSSDLLTMHFLQLFSAEEKKRFAGMLTSLLTDDRQLVFDFSFVIETEKGKETKTFIFTGEKLNETSIIGIIQPPSNLQKTINELNKAKEKAEDSNQLKSNFLSNISHAIRTPMNSILGFTELINIGELPPDKRKSYMDIIKIKGNQLLNLIDDIAEIAKFETGKITVQNSNVELNKLLFELKLETEKSKTKLNKDNISIFLSIPPEHSNLNIYTDSGRLSQILASLLDNALKFTDKGYIEFGYLIKDTRYLQFYVKDTGMGIPKERQKGVFSPFRQIEDASHRSAFTSGLGLTLAKGFVEILGGKIWLDSELGKGSIFNFTLPLLISSAIQDEISKEAPVHSTFNWKNKVILIVEDEEINFRFLEAVLDKTDAKIIHAETGMQAVELVKTLPRIDLILMDIRLPEMNGFEATIEIKKIKNNLPIIAQTAYSLVEDRDKCFECGCDDYLVKPIDIDILLDKLNRYLAN